MSIFNHTGYFGGHNIDAPSVLESYVLENDTADVIAIESTQDLMSVTESVMLMDHVLMQSKYGVLENTTVLESAGGNLITRIKKFFNNLWQRVRSFFANIVRTFDSYTKSAEDFAKKYEKQLRMKDTTGLEMDIVRFKNIKPNTLDGLGQTGVEIRIEMSLQNQKKYISDEDSVKNSIEIARGSLLKKGPLDNESFREELYEFFHNGSDKSDATEKDVRPDVNVALAEIKETKSHADAVKKAQKEIDKQFKNALKHIDKLSTEISKIDASKVGDNSVVDTSDLSDNHKTSLDGATVEDLGTYTQYLNAVSRETSGKQQAQTAFVNAYASAVRERNTQNMAILRRVLSYRPKKDK